MMQDIQNIKQAIFDEKKEIISFDLFDTLVYRSSYTNKNHLRLFASWVSRKYGIDIEEERLSAQEKIQNSYATLDEIWQYIATEKNIDHQLKVQLMEMEFEFDLQHLHQCELGRYLYSQAVLSGKKIIVLSDMYYSSHRIGKILKRFGYSEVSSVYVSCEKKQ